MDAGTRGVYVGGANGTLYLSRNAHTANLGDIVWEPVHTFTPAYLPIRWLWARYPPLSWIWDGGRR